MMVPISRGRGILVDSGRRKLCTIMGDNVHTGINSMLNVGSLIEPDTNINPGEFLKLDNYLTIMRKSKEENQN